MTKLKYCEEGNHEVSQLFWAKSKTRKSACASCARKYAKPLSSKVKVIESWNPLNEPKSTTVSKPKQKPIKTISNKKYEALKRYRRLRDKYFEQHPVCEYPECNSHNITLHHMKGRIGNFLTDKRFFKSLCVKHHKFVEENPIQAQKLGLSLKRLDK